MQLRYLTPIKTGEHCSIAYLGTGLSHKVCGLVDVKQQLSLARETPAWHDVCWMGFFAKLAHKSRCMVTAVKVRLCDYWDR